jgi:D-aminopeptidase
MSPLAQGRGSKHDPPLPASVATWSPLAQGTWTLPAPEWLGAYVEPETGLSVRVDAPHAGQVRLRYGHSAEQLDLHADGTAGHNGTRLHHGADGLWMERPGDNQTSRLVPREGVPARDVAGRYRCDELEAELTVSDAGGVLYGAFSGFLGGGRMEMLEPVGPDMWAVPCPRALDHTPPGDWTVAVQRGGGGRVIGVEVGCWLARRLSYRRVD